MENRWRGKLAHFSGKAPQEAGDRQMSTGDRVERASSPPGGVPLPFSPPPFPAAQSGFRVPPRRRVSGVARSPPIFVFVGGHPPCPPSGGLRPPAPPVFPRSLRLSLASGSPSQVGFRSCPLAPHFCFRGGYPHFPPSGGLHPSPGGGRTLRSPDRGHETLLSP